MGEFDMGEFTPPDDETIPDISSLPNDGIDLGDIDFGGFGGKGGFDNNGGFDMGSSDVKLQYIDDDPDSYSNIFDNAKTDIDSSDEERLIESLESLSNYESARPNQGGMNFPGAQNGNLSTQSEMSSSSSNTTIWVWLGISAVILGAGLIIAKLYRY